MSNSKEERQANVNHALNLFFNRLGVQWIRAFLIDPKDPDYAEIYTTTWGELTERFSYIIAVLGGHFYSLTPAGLMACLESRNVPQSADFQADVGKLCSRLKDSVKGRSMQALVTVEELERDTGLTHGFICNLIDLRYIDYNLNRYGATWASGFEGRMIIVPTNFGLESL